MGADSVIPFSGGGAIKEVVFGMYSSGYQFYIMNDDGVLYTSDLNKSKSIKDPTGNYFVNVTAKLAGYYATAGYYNTIRQIAYYNAGATITIGGANTVPATVVYFGTTNPYA